MKFSASMLVCCVCLPSSRCSFACPFRSVAHNSTGGGGQQIGKIRFSRSSDQRSRSRSDDNGNLVISIDSEPLKESEPKLIRTLTTLERGTDNIFKVNGSKVKIDFASIAASPRSLIHLVCFL